MPDKNFYFTQFFFLFLEVKSNLIQPQYAVKILNTENIILSFDNLDNRNNDLEVINDYTENPNLRKKLSKFHGYVEAIKTTEKITEDVIKRNSYQILPFLIKLKELQENEEKKRQKLYWLKKPKRYSWKRNWIIAKRETPTGEDENEDKDYDIKTENLEKEYDELLNQRKINNTMYKYTDEGKPEESVMDVMQKIVNIKTPDNCTNIKGIGIQAVECALKNAKNKEISQRMMFENIFYIFLAWFCIYLALAIPLWCTKGWCCCCCRCSFCFPEKTVKAIQNYIAENPPGVYVNSKGEEEHYNPNIKETELYEIIKKKIYNF